MMNLNFFRSKLIIFLIVLFFLIGATSIFIFFKSPAVSRISVYEYVKVCDGNDDQCHPKNLPYQNPALSVETRVADLMSRMTMAEKIGQMALVEKNSISNLNDIARYGLGAVLSGGGGKPNNNTPEGWLSMVTSFQSYSQKTRLSIPLLYGVDANHGHSNVPGATIFPHFIGLGASHDPDLVREVAEATAREVVATGINWVFSPDLDIASDIRWGRTYETFGSDPKLVSTLGKAYIDGLQSFNKNGLSMVATAKHYLGNGSSQWGSSINKNFLIDQGNSNLSEAELRKVQLEPFRQAIKTGVKSIMVGLNKWKGEKIVFNKYLLTDILKGELGFKGLVVSDWYGIYEQEPDKYKALVGAINAGVDMVMLPYDYQFFSDNLQRALVSGENDQKRIDEAVQRILQVKFETGLFDKVALSPPNLKEVGSKINRELARRAVRESLVLLKNNRVVPLAKNISQILVAGSAANNLGEQSGGWTVEWQGIDGNWIPGTTILQGIQATVSPSTKVGYNLKGNFVDQPSLADIGIAVVGERPYAEGWGDNESPKLSAQDLEAISNLKKVSKKIIVIVVSGRPLKIGEYVKDWDTILAVWLPGSEGQGVADVLFGDYPFRGTLPVDWNLEKF
ncbi:MAG: glycoside hydrolase family 3 protein [Candidatus Gribaldobacteria bacterium]|nr:glycoside hydrolase family 3 protein [Candidatus Gribaldobacteria bacterium]